MVYLIVVVISNEQSMCMTSRTPTHSKDWQELVTTFSLSLYDANAMKITYKKNI